MNIKYSQFVLPLILIITFLVYIPSLSCGFTNWDDQNHLTENPHLRIQASSDYFSIPENTVNRAYIPLTLLSFRIEHSFFGLQPFIYHLNNVFLHLGIIALIFLFGRLLGASELASGIGALIFGLHPMHVESVTWVTERKDVLYALFYMLALIQYGYYLKNKSLRNYSLSLFFGLLSMLAKPMALSLPLILLLLDFWMNRKWDRKIILDKIPFLLVIIPLGWMTFSAFEHLTVTDMKVAASIYVWSFMFYLAKFFFPTNLSPLYDLPRPIDWHTWPYLLSLIGFGAFLIGLWRFRNNKWLAFAVAWYVLSIFFILRFHDVRILGNFSLVADRFMYLPSFGFCLALGVGIERLLIVPKHNKLWMCLLGGLIIFLACQSILMEKIWKNSGTLWNYAIKRSPKDFVGFNNRGDYFLEKKDYQSAIHDYNQALQLSPAYWKALNNRGISHYYLHAYAQALTDLNRAIIMNPRYAKAYLNRGRVWLDLGKNDEAYRDFNKALELEPNIVDALINRGIVQAKKNNLNSAIQDFSRALEINPNLALAWNNRGAIYLEKNFLDLALADFNEAVKIDPAYADAYYNRGKVNFNLGQYVASISDLTQVIKIGAHQGLAHFYIGKCYDALGQNASAQESWREAESIFLREGNQKFLTLTQKLLIN